MATKKDQHKVGIPAKPRGQQMGTKRVSDQNREEMDQTPALRGRRKYGNKMFSDKSSQHIGSDATKPKSNRPSLPALVDNRRKGESGGEKVFKTRLKRVRSAKKRA